MTSFENAIALTPAPTPAPTPALTPAPTPALTPAPSPADGTLSGWQVPDGWQQGRGAWGGLAIGAMILAVEQAETEQSSGGPDRTVRSVSMQLCGPAVIGLAEVMVEPVRIGTGMSTWSVRVTDPESSVIATGTVITGAPRRSSGLTSSTPWSPLEAPAAPPAADVPTVPTPAPFPPFTQHFDYRVASGFPLQGSPAETLGWIGYRDSPSWSAASLIALADAWYTATLVHLRELTSISTVEFTASLLIDPADLDPGTPLLHHGIVSSFREGYASEQRRLWTPDGRLAVDNLQAMVVG